MPTLRPPFVDAHVHLWDLSRDGYQWLRPQIDENGTVRPALPIATTYLLDDYRAEVADWNLAGFVHVEAGAGIAHARVETTWLQAYADKTGQPNGLVAIADLRSSDLDDLLRFHCRHRNVRGIRQQINWHQDPSRCVQSVNLLDDPDWCAGFALLAKHGLSFDLQCYPGQARQFAALTERNPQIPVIVNHYGMPIESDRDGLQTWREGLRDLAANGHVSIKLSGAGFIHSPWTADSIRPYVQETIDVFGPQRVMVASNFPTDRLFESMNYTLGVYEEILAEFSAEDRRDLWGRNANRIYRLGLEL